MSADSRFHKMVRARMARTGEKYTHARREILQDALNDPDNADRDTISYLRANPEVVEETRRMMPRSQ
jgi:hypothetical protein